mgnify:FL=1
MNHVSNNIIRMVEQYRLFMINKDIDMKRQEAEIIEQHLKHIKEVDKKVREPGKGHHVDVSV